MSLKGLMLRKELENKQKALNAVKEKREELNKREAELEESIEELNEESTEEEQKTVEEAVKAHEEEIKAIEDEIKSLSEQIEEIKLKIENYNDKGTDSNRDKKYIETRGGIFMGMEKRERLANILRNDEVREFYRTIGDVISKREAFTSSKDLLIPTEVVYEIHQLIGEYGSLYNLVNKINLSGKGRIIINSGDVVLHWTENCEPLKEVTLGELNAVELDSYKLGGYVFLCNAMIEDSAIDLADYINNEFAKGIAIALDKAIYSGTGNTGKQPEGITKTVTETTEVKTVLDLLSAVGEIGITGLNYTGGEVCIVANRKTLYKFLYPETYGKDANGKLVYGLGSNLPDGTKVYMSNVIADDEVVIGDFKNGYTLGIRKEMTFDSNDRIKWIEEQTGYKVSGRYDGKVVRKDLFKRVVFKPVLEM